jgi:hypothetical protein
MALPTMLELSMACLTPDIIDKQMFKTILPKTLLEKFSLCSHYNKCFCRVYRGPERFHLQDVLMPLTQTSCFKCRLQCRLCNMLSFNLKQVIVSNNLMDF